MTKDEVLLYLSKLNDKMRSCDIRGQIVIFGGVVMTFLGARNTTRDIDAYFDMKEISVFRKLIHEVALENGLIDDWLNDGVKGFLTGKNSMKLLDIGLSNLDIYLTNPEQVLAMKVSAFRTEEDSSDVDDIKFLIEYLNIKKISEVYDMLIKYLPEYILQPKMLYRLSELGLLWDKD